MHLLQLLAIFFTALFSLSAQQTTATVTGTAFDPSGAALPSVQVKLTNTQTNVVRETQTDQAGAYSIPFLPAGRYQLAAAATGFKSTTVQPFDLQVGQTARLDLRLEVGDVTQSLDVSASAAALQTESASVGAVIDAAKIVDLPLNGRNFVQLAQLIPGVQPGTPGSITVRRGRGSVGDTSRSFGQTAMSANGARDTNNRFYLDGVEFMDYDAFSYPFALSVDSLSEFRVETSTYSAEYGASPGGQVSILTRRGANSYRGTLWEFNRNNALTQTYDAIGDKSVTSPRLNRNQFGANIGGPVLIPKLYNGKDKTFFFFNWESGRSTNGAAAGFARVPPAEMRTGDFRNLRDSRTGNPITLRDPLNIGIVNNIIPQRFLSEQALTFLKYVPQPNTSVANSNYISTPQSGIAAQDNYTTRIDHNLSSKDALSFRYVFNDTTEAGTPFWGNDIRDNLARTQNISSTYTRTISSSIVNEFRFGWSNMTEYEIFGTTDNPAFDIAGAMKIPLVSRRSKDYGPPSISINNGPDGGYSVYNLQRQIGPRDRANAVYDFNDILSLQRGRHFIKLGVDILHRNFTFQQARDPRGTFNFDGRYTGSSLADFMLGYLARAQINPDPTNTDLVGVWQSYFLQDDWKITPRLTLNLGLRYDYLQPFRDSQGRMANIEQDGLFLTRLVTPKDSSFGPALVRGDKNNFGPRFGLAWRPNGLADTVLRAGYGIYYNHIHPNAPFGMTESSQARNSFDVIGSTSARPDIFFNDPFRSAGTPGLQLNAVPSNDPYYRDAYIQQWNFTLQRKIGGFLLDSGYVGSKGTRLSVTIPGMNRPIALNNPSTPGLASLNSRRPNPAFQRGVQGDKSIGNSTYHALQMRADRRMAKGLTSLTAYTWSKCMSGPSDIGADIGGGSFIGGIQDIYNHVNERSLCGMDVTQRFVQSLIWDIPFFQNSNRFTRTILGGWQLSSIIVVQSGFVADVTHGVDTTATGVNSRASLVSGQKANLDPSERTYLRWFNTAAFAAPTPGTFGTSPRTGAIRLPGLFNVDLSVNKSFRFADTRRAELRTEFYNLPNRYNIEPGSVDRGFRSVNFGRVGGGIQGLTTRVIQIGLKLYF